MPTDADESCRPPGCRHPPSRISRASDDGAAPEHEHERNRELGDRLTVDAAGPPHRDATARGGGQIDHVEAHAVFAHDAKLRHCREHRLVEHLESGDRHLVAPQEPDEVVAGKRTAGRVVDGVRVARFELAPQGRVFGEGVGGDGDGHGADYGVGYSIRPGAGIGAGISAGISR